MNISLNIIPESKIKKWMLEKAQKGQSQITRSSNNKHPWNQKDIISAELARHLQTNNSLNTSGNCLTTNDK